jgi:hypothetical protein
MIKMQPDGSVHDVEKNTQQDNAIPVDQQEGSTAFREQPPEKDTERTRDRIRPHQLFSLFTADIIEKNIVFVR